MIWTLMMVIIPIITPEYPIVWDEERELAMIIDDEEHTSLMICKIAGNNYKKNNTNVISYQCRAEI